MIAAMRYLAALVVCALIPANAIPAAAQDAPSVPCTTEVTAVPAFGPLGAPPAVAAWRDIDVAPVPCIDMLKAGGRPELVVAMAGRFVADASLEALAARVGAITETEGLMYWSTTDGNWRTLIEASHAVTGPDGKTARADFTAAEMLSGRTLYFMQQDSRSTSDNVYAMTGRRLGPDRFVVEAVNVTPIRVFFITMFAPKSVVAAHIFARVEDRGDGSATWAYYGVSAAETVPLGGQERSFINRAAALYRFFAGRPGDRDPPLAP
jgi:hypothetical protein